MADTGCSYTLSGLGFGKICWIGKRNIAGVKGDPYLGESNNANILVIFYVTFGGGMKLDSDLPRTMHSLFLHGVH